VEVKTRASEWFGRPVAAVNRDKIHRLSRAASRYIKRLKKKPRFMRFDVVEVVGTPANGVPPEIRHIESAFTMSRSFHLQW
jgi:putative endonuclease